MNEIEEKLWNYIDGSCPEAERGAINVLIETDEAYRQKYQELLQFEASLEAIELDEPSMAFTYHVMEAIRTETALKPLKAAIDKRIIWGIAAFFGLTIAGLLVIVLTGINWSAGGGAGISLPFKVDMPQLSGYFNANTLRAFIMFDIVLSLFLLDTYLRKKLNSKQTS